MTTAGTLARGRDAFARQAWAEAYELLGSADRQRALEPADLARLAEAAYLIGRDADRDTYMERAHQGFLDRGDAPRAARCAFWLGVGLLDRGEPARGGGWLARAQRLVAEVDCVERGYLLVAAGLQDLDRDPASAHATFTEVAAVADRFADPDLTALGRLGQGQALVRQERTADGLALLDEVMVAVEAGEVSAIPAGIIYCAVISACQHVFDVRRAGQWTSALNDWCAAQPDLVPYRGQCLVHRAEILQTQGAWSDAMREALRACERLSDPPGQPAVGAAHYQRAELHRLRGEFAEAERAYREASRWGRSPQPGLAQLRLAQGKVADAAAALRRLLDETQDRALRARMLAVQVEVALAADDLAGARAAATELAGIAAVLDVPLLHAASAHVTGAVLLVDGDARAAVASLRAAAAAWRELQAPFECARARVLVGLACQRLADRDGAQMELDAARAIFAELGATPELARLERLTARPAAAAPGGLTAREVEVLRLVAAGRTNRAIATELVISEHTVARHVQNIFAKLDVASRTAAAAFAHTHGLASPPAW